MSAEVTAPRRWLVLGICCLSLLVVGIDVTIVNVALPQIGRDLGAGIGGLQWTIDAYTLVLASLLLLSGTVADRFGRRRVFRIGLVVFTLASAACGLAPTLGVLIGCRVAQAIGGAMLNPVALSIIRSVFSDKAERARALGVWAAAFGLAMGIGPLVGGTLLQMGLGWRAVFWVNLPVGLAAIMLVTAFVPESRAEQPRHADLIGQGLVITLLAASIYAIIQAPESGWTAPSVLGCLLLAVVAAALLFRFEPRQSQPLIEFTLFRRHSFTMACVITIATFAAFGGLLLLNTIYLQTVRGDDAFTAGLLLAPMSAMGIIGGPFSGRLVAKHGPRIPLIAAGIAMTIGAIQLTVVSASTPIAWLLLSYLVFGAGFALVGPPVNAIALAGLPPERAGLGAGIATTSRQLGQALGVAVIGSIVAAQSHTPAMHNFTDAAVPAWWTVAGCGVVVTLLSVFGIRTPDH